MRKIEEAQQILRALGLPSAQQNEIAGYTLLALADLRELQPWPEARRRSVRIHDILVFLKTAYNKGYAENTRETVRRQVLHQFVQARVVDHNPDDPRLGTNSPRNHYALSVAALQVIRAFGTVGFAEEVREFLSNQGALREIYEAKRSYVLASVKLPSGLELVLSPGKHNELQRDVLYELWPRFMPDALLLYLGDTANKSLFVDQDRLKILQVPLTQHDKVPDVIFYDPMQDFLFLVEAVTSHGPVSPKRKHELEALLRECAATVVYISAFPNLGEFKRHLEHIAWETEVWIAEVPDHLIHFDGEKFLGPQIDRRT